MIKDLNKVVNNSLTLNIFWHSDKEVFPKIVQLAIHSWILQGHNVNVWTLGRTYKMPILPQDVRFVDFESIVGKDNIPYEMMSYQKKPFSTSDDRTILGFVDWCRYKIMSILPFCTIMDTDVILLKPFDYVVRDTPTIVCEESFRGGNMLYGLYPCAGIIQDNGTLGKFLEPKARELAYNGMPHGTIMKAIYDYMVQFHELDFENYSKGMHVRDLDIVDNNAFFELGYDELDVFYEPLRASTTRRIKDVIGIHCWNSLLDHDRAFQGDGTLLDILWNLIVVHRCKPNYRLLKLPNMAI